MTRTAITLASGLPACVQVTGPGEQRDMLARQRIHIVNLGWKIAKSMRLAIGRSHPLPAPAARPAARTRIAFLPGFT